MGNSFWDSILATVPDTAEFNSAEQKKINRFSDSKYRAIFKEELIAFRQERKNYTESAVINATGKYVRTNELQKIRMVF